ncbi:MAG: TorF family putative porin [Cellvibrionaceae bacterium]
MSVLISKIRLHQSLGVEASSFLVSTSRIIPALKAILLGFCLWLNSAGTMANGEDDACGSDKPRSVWSGKLTLASDYVFRGESETADGDIPAVQGTASWTHCSQWYAGLFVSSNKFKSSPDVDTVVAPFVGKTGDLGFTGLDYNVFIFHYAYPNARELDYTELWIYLGKSFDRWRLSAEITPTLNDWFGVDGWSGVNYALHPSYNFESGLSVSGSYGFKRSAAMAPKVGSIGIWG